MSLLDNHPWFKVVALAASDRSVGQQYAQAARWVLDVPMPDYAKDMVIVPANTDAVQAKIVFSALHSDVAKDLEPQFARAGAAVCSNASSYRRWPGNSSKNSGNLDRASWSSKRRSQAPRK
jgi:aspartate-semialdehyde dehydrogenase